MPFKVLSAYINEDGNLVGSYQVREGHGLAKSYANIPANGRNCPSDKRFRKMADLYKTRPVSEPKNNLGFRVRYSGKDDATLYFADYEAAFDVWNRDQKEYRLSSWIEERHLDITGEVWEKVKLPSYRKNEDGYVEDV